MRILFKNLLLLAAALLIPVSGMTQDSEPATPVGKSLSGVVFDDENEDGLMQEGESSAIGVIVDLLDADGNFVLRVLTGENGTYNFEGLADGVYFLRFEFSPGFAVRSRGIEVGGEDFVFIPIPVIRPDSQYSFTRLQLTNPANFMGAEVSPFTP
jgi:hypothetical protein